MSAPLSIRNRAFSQVVLASAVGLALLMVRSTSPDFGKMASAACSVVQGHSNHARRAWLEFDTSLDSGLASGRARLSPPITSVRILIPSSTPHRSYQPSYSYRNRPPPLG